MINWLVFLRIYHVVARIFLDLYIKVVQLDITFFTEYGLAGTDFLELNHSELRELFPEPDPKVLHPNLKKFLDKLANLLSQVILLQNITLVLCRISIKSVIKHECIIF